MTTTKERETLAARALDRIGEILLSSAIESPHPATSKVAVLATLKVPTAPTKVPIGAVS